MRRLMMLRTAALAPVILALLTGRVAAGPAPAQLLVDIPAGPLARALELYAAETHQQLLYSSEIVAGRTVGALKGRFTPDQALGRLLSGSDILAEHTAPSVVVLKRKAISSEARLQKSSQTDDGQRVEGGNPTPGAASSSAASDRGSTENKIEPTTEIIVTGTHIRGARASASPLVRINAEDLRRDGDATIADALDRLPQSFSGSATPNSLAVGSDRVATNFSSAQGVNLRGLGANATLVLIDGRRLAGTGSQGDFTDVSAIPTAAVDHVEVLLDGASAIYGSDAVGGVVNIVMKKDFHGAETSVRFGSDAGSTAGSEQVSQVFGFDWDGGHLLATLEAQHDDRLAASSRRYTANSDLTALGGTSHDVFLSSPGNILGFNAGALVPLFAIPGGSGVGLQPTDFVAGTANEENIRLGTDLTPRQDRVGAYVAAEQALGPRTTLNLTARYSRRSYAYSSNSEETEFTVTKANPFFVSPNGAASELIGYATDVTGPEQQLGTSVSWDTSAGLDQKLGRTWRLDAYGGYAEEIGRSESRNFWNSTHLSEALGNTPDNPATAFNTARDGFFNPYGDGRSNSAAVLNFIDDGFLQTKDVNQIATLSAQADGTIITLPGGALKAAFGAQYRHERFEPSVFELASSTPFTSGGTPFSREVAAVFGELNIPLVGPGNAIPGIERLELSLAGRIEHYSDVGTTKNPKIGLVWQPAHDWRVHATYSTSFRAPTLPEVNTPLHTEAPMADFKLRLTDELADHFDNWAADRGGRSPALRHLIATACASAAEPTPNQPRLDQRPLKLSVRLTAADGGRLQEEAATMGLTRSAWVAALVRHRLTGKPTFAQADTDRLVGIQSEIRRIGVNVNQIARALNTAVLEGQVLALELAYLENLRTELRVHVSTLREAFAGNLSYWESAP